MLIANVLGYQNSCHLISYQSGTQRTLKVSMGLVSNKENNLQARQVSTCEKCRLIIFTLGDSYAKLPVLHLNREQIASYHPFGSTDDTAVCIPHNRIAAF